LLDAKYDSFPGVTEAGPFRPYTKKLPWCNATGSTCNASGRNLIDAPKISLAVAADYKMRLHGGGSLDWRGDYSYQSTVYFDPSNVPIAGQPGFGLLNLAVTYNPFKSKWNATVFVRNVADTQYLTSAKGNGAGPVGQIGAPRTFGLRLNYDF
jgi:outer membrane receptor protein involved in Fe transport